MTLFFVTATIAILEKFDVDPCYVSIFLPCSDGDCHGEKIVTELSTPRPGAFAPGLFYPTKGLVATLESLI